METWKLSDEDVARIVGDVPDDILARALKIEWWSGREVDIKRYAERALKRDRTPDELDRKYLDNELWI